MSRVKPRTPAPVLPDRPLLPDRPGRWKLLLRRQRQLLRPALAGTVLLGAIFAISLVMQSLGNGQNFRDRIGDATGQFGLRVQTIRIDGRQKTLEEDVLQALGVHKGDAILGFSVAAARSRIEAINWVQTATIERRLPGTIVVQLVERRPFAVWQHEGKFTLVDRAGDIVTDSDVAAFAGLLPLVVGPGAPKATAALLEMLAVQPDLQARMIAAVRVGERRWNLRMNNGADILLPEGAEPQALAKLAALQASHALLDRPLAAVDLRLPDRLIIRPAGDPARAAPQGKKPA